MSIQAILNMWFWYLIITFCLNVVIVIWVTVGGVFDLKYFFKVLKEEKIDDTDDGRVTENYTLEFNKTDEGCGSVEEGLQGNRK